ncbi:MAG: hypothetical protein ACE5J7_02260 [Candidatus Aenigmatarchaeota archaeon]
MSCKKTIRRPIKDHMPDELVIEEEKEATDSGPKAEYVAPDKDIIKVEKVELVIDRKTYGEEYITDNEIKEVEKGFADNLVDFLCGCKEKPRTSTRIVKDVYELADTDDSGPCEYDFAKINNPCPLARKEMGEYIYGRGIDEFYLTFTLTIDGKKEQIKLDRGNQCYGRRFEKCPLYKIALNRELQSGLDTKDE